MVSKASSSRHAHHNAVDRMVESRAGVDGCDGSTEACPAVQRSGCRSCVRCETTSVKKCVGYEMKTVANGEEINKRSGGVRTIKRSQRQPDHSLCPDSAGVQSIVRMVIVGGGPQHAGSG